MDTPSDSTLRDPRRPPLSQGRILVFWVPLALTWLMMASEGPFITAIIARLDEPKFNLAAYGVAFSLALIVEAPVIMLMSASTNEVLSTTTEITAVSKELVEVMRTPSRGVHSWRAFGKTGAAHQRSRMGSRPTSSTYFR